MDEYFEWYRFDFDFNELDGALGLGDCIFDFRNEPGKTLYWMVKVYAEIDESTQTHSETLEQPAENKCTYKLHHVDLLLITKLPNGIDLPILMMEEWEMMGEFENIKAKMDSIDWSQVHY